MLGSSSSNTKLWRAATSESELAEMARIQQAIEAKDGWRMRTQIETTLTQLGLDGDRFLRDLSGGWRRRVPRESFGITARFTATR